MCFVVIFKRLFTLHSPTYLIKPVLDIKLTNLEKKPLLKVTSIRNNDLDLLI